MNEKLEHRLNQRAEKMIRSLQDENRQLRAENKSKDDQISKAVSAKLPVIKDVAEKNVVEEPSKVVKLRIDLEMAKEELCIERQKKEMMGMYLNVDENLNHQVADESAAATSAIKSTNDELDQFFQMLSPIKK